MKKLLTTILLFTAIVTSSQNLDERFALSFSTEPNAWSDGLNFGVDINYQMTYTYFSFGIFSFPNLNNIGYFQVHGVPIGFNLHSKFRDLRGYTGLILGTNFRQGNPNPIAGIEGGLDWYFKGIGIGINFNYIRRGDAEFYGGKEWMLNTSVRFIVVL
jgi:hypothetical protein